MKDIKIYLCFLLSFLFMLNVSAAGCSYKEQTQLNTDLSNIKIISEIVDDNKINIIIYNVTENLQIVYQNPENEQEVTLKYFDTTNGKYVLERNADTIEEYSFQIRSNMSNCYGNILSTKKIIKPKYNEFSELDICKNSKLQNHSYCQKYITKDINKSREEVEQTLNDFLQVRVDKITTRAVKKPFLTVKQIITYSIGLVIVSAIVVVILLITKKRSEL